MTFFSSCNLNRHQRHEICSHVIFVYHVVASFSHHSGGVLAVLLQPPATAIAAAILQNVPCGKENSVSGQVTTIPPLKATKHQNGHGLSLKCVAFDRASIAFCLPRVDVTPIYVERPY